MSAPSRFSRLPAVPPRACIAVLAMTLFFTRLGAAKLWDRDEPRNARCAWEMFERADWVVPTYNGELRTHKPILLYWLTLASYHVLGVSEFSARVPSAALSVGTVLLTFGIGRRIFDRRTAGWSATILSTTLMFNVAAHAATPDATLIFCCTLALYALVAGIPPASWRSPQVSAGELRVGQGAAISAGVALGLAMLAKGPVGLVLPLTVWTVFVGGSILAGAGSAATTVGPGDTAAWQQRVRSLTLRLTWAHGWQTLHTVRAIQTLLLAVLVAAPWYYVVGQRTAGVWLREFFLEHNVSRAMQPMEGHDGNALLFYPVAILVGFFPWSIFAAPVALWIWRQRTPAGFCLAHRLLFCWIGVFVGAFSCAGTKLPSYVTPTYPALALLCGQFVATWPATRSSIALWWPQCSAATLLGIGAAICLGVPLAAAVYLPGESWLGVAGVIPIVGGWLAWNSFGREQYARGMQQVAATAIVLTLATWAVLAPRVSAHQQIEQLVGHRSIDSSTLQAARLSSWGVHEPSWVFYAGRTIPLLDARRPQDALDVLLRQHGSLITSQTQYEVIRQQLPPEIVVQHSIPYFLRDEHLVLLSRQTRDTPSPPSLPPARAPQVATKAGKQRPPR